MIQDRTAQGRKAGSSLFKHVYFDLTMALGIGVDSPYSVGHRNSAYSEAQVDPRIQEFEADMGNISPTSNMLRLQ